MRPIAALALALLVALGCTTPYSLKVDGDVQGSDKETPRSVKAQIYEGSDHCRAKFEEAAGHLKPLTDAKVSYALKLRKEEKPRSWQAVGIDSRTAKFHFEASGEDGPLSGVHVKVEAPGRQTVERIFPSPPDVPFEAQLLAVLDEAGAPVAPVTPDKPADPKK
ncbi:hypothetical protein HY251_08975 [bacterium]|nr:hypothetical protein [bacterium]